jgi:hypothetical protein
MTCRLAILLLVALPCLMQCQPDHTTPVATGDPLFAVDSVLTMSRPDFEGIIAASRTPVGALDRVEKTVLAATSPTTPASESTTVLKLLYNQAGQPGGYTSTLVGLPFVKGTTMVVYTYKDGRPHRVVSATITYEYDATRDYTYWVTEYVYNRAGQAIGEVLYRLYPEQQKAALIGRSRYELDGAGNVIASRSVNVAGQITLRSVYKDGNVVTVYSVDAVGNELAAKQEYVYDGRPNPLKGRVWSLNGDWLTALSQNNVAAAIRKTNNQLDTEVRYTLTYDARNRLARQAYGKDLAITTSVFHYQD